ncbi:MAG: PTS transporter subunit EIIC [Floccifex sp.]
MNYNATAKSILANIGGSENVESVTHCITRVRFVLKDESKANDAAVKEIDGVMSLIKAGGQYQVVIGTEVEKVYNEVLKEGNLKDGGSVEQTDGDRLVNAAKAHKQKQGFLSSALRLVSELFAPTLAILTAGGMIKALLVLLTTVFGVLSTDSGTYIILSAVGDAVFYFFPVVLGWTSAKRFGLPEIYGIIIGAVMVYPTIISLSGAESIGTLFSGTFLASEYPTTFLGIPCLLRNYSGTVVPIILVSWVTSYIYKFFNKNIPAVLKAFFVPFLTLLISMPLAFLVIGPIAMIIQNTITVIVQWLVGLNTGIAGFVLGATWSVLVMFGLHWAVIPFFSINIMTYGYDVINPLIFAGAIASMGSVLGVLIREKNMKERSIELPALISTFFGVNEPALYGVLIPRKKIMLTCFCGAGIGGAIAGFAGAKLWAFSASGILGLPGFINPAGIDGGFIGLVVGAIVAFVFCLVTALVIGAEKD